MASVELGAATIHYDIEGVDDGYPVFLIAPGGMRSANEYWGRMPWNPRQALAGEYRLIGMDQRNAGRSTAPVSGDDGWATYRADQIGLLDALGIERCHVLGMCIGGPYIAALLAAAPERFTAAVMLQPVGIDDDNRAVFAENFDEWATPIADDHPEASPADWASYRSNMFGGEFVVSTTREQVAAITVPLLVAMGNDIFHPSHTSREIAELAPHVTFLERWKDEDSLLATDQAIKQFLAGHTPAAV